MSFVLRNAHSIEHYNADLQHNHDHQVNHLADEVAHNLRFAAFGFHSNSRFDFAAKELAFDATHLTKADFDREVSAIQYRLPGRDLNIQHDKSGHVTHIRFDGHSIY